MKKEKSVKSDKFKKAVIEKAKEWAFPLILLAIILGGVYYVINHENAKVEEPVIQVNGYEGSTDAIVMKSDGITFAMDPSTTHFTVTNNKTGKVWYSNPQDALNDTIALPAEKNKLNSTLIMSFAIETGLETFYDNYGYSIGNGLYEIESGDDFVKVHYSLGDIEREYIIPPVCTAEVFKSYTDQMSNADKNLVQQYYKKYDINKLGKKDNKEELLENYPIIAESIIYVLRDTTKANVRLKMEEVFEGIGYTYEQYLQDKELSNAERASDKPVFNVSMVYRLDGDDLIVEIPFSDLEYPTGKYIYTINPLPYFGAGGKDDTGFMFVPEGGGGIINFNNGKISQNSYYANVYGWDMALSRKEVVHNTRAYYGVFGVGSEKDSFLCMLENGAPYASVQADIAGKVHTYNYVNAVYNACVREQYDVGSISNSDIYVYWKDLPEEVLSQRYRFIDSSDYVDMAKEYQNYLVDKYGDALSPVTDTSTPVVVEVVSAVDKVKQILGVPVSRPLPLTTFDETAEMMDTFVADGMTNLSLKLVGWCNGGVKQKLLERVKPISSLGGKKDLKSLSSKANQLGVNLYLNGITQYEYNSNLFDGFFSFTDAAKMVSKERAELHIYSDVTYAARKGTDPYYLLHTDLAYEMAQNLKAAADSYSAGVAFDDTGKDLSSDFYRKDYSSRYDVMREQAQMLQSMQESGTNVMINMGNDFALPYSDMVTNMDLRGSEYTIIDEAVPFYQLAIHGLKNYTGFPINITGNDEQQILYCAEYGAGLNFSMMKESAFALQKTLYTEYYGSAYDAWHDRMVDIYTRYNKELGHTFNQKMVGHDNISTELSCTTYEDGTKVYVNYSYEDITSPDGVVPARDYMVIR